MDLLFNVDSETRDTLGATALLKCQLLARTSCSNKQTIVYIGWGLRWHVLSLCGPPTKYSPSLMLLNKGLGLHAMIRSWSCLEDGRTVVGVEGQGGILP